ncbi:hypothetical protein CspeluHIS016_0402750 [Cutaneotrichosporon spelunceum]|uniref:F-box domain-containing protein n=1 Tax=Cutaneotrichosporon spelunceum TaxID=1672016 RepID=A0AAD3YBW5_9TREE|nr:hypothetical protein CspeluHIS016_0402750 [Cutaneotrichosporon spelunceum]
MQAGVSNTRRIGARRTPLDRTWFPHILSRVVDVAPLDALLGLRATCRCLRDVIDGKLFEHVVLVTVSPRSASAKTGVGFVSPHLLDRLLPCIPSVRQLPREADGPRTQDPAHLASNKRIMGHIRILDSATARIYDLPSLSVNLVRRCNPAAAGLPANVISETRSLSPTDEDDGVFRAWDRFRQLAVTVTGTTPFGAPGARVAGGGGTLVAHLTYDGPPRRGTVFNIRSKLHELVIVLPEVPEDADAGEVVEGLRVTLMMALSVGGGRIGTRITLVGVDRFGARHFGFPDAEDEIEAVRDALLAHCRLEPDDDRLACLTYDVWAAGVSPDINTPPPFIPNTVIGEDERSA